MIKYYAQFFKKLKTLGYYLIKFYNNYFIKEKVFFLNYVINDQNKRPLILILYNKNIFLVNNN